jgi:hypothetical protein
MRSGVECQGTGNFDCVYCVVEVILEMIPETQLFHDYIAVAT